MRGKRALCLCVSTTRLRGPLVGALRCYRAVLAAIDANGTFVPGGLALDWQRELDICEMLDDERCLLLVRSLERHASHHQRRAISHRRESAER